MLYVNGERVPMKRFPNNEIYLDFMDKDARKPGGQPTDLFHKNNLPENEREPIWVGLQYESSDDIVGLGLLVDWLRDMGYEELKLSMPYIPYSTMDHIDKEKSRPLSLRFMARFINSLNFRKVVVMEPHSAVSEAMIDRLEVIDQTMELFNEAVRDMNLRWSDVIAVFPDEGARKRYEGQLDRIQLWEGGRVRSLTFSKDRNFDNGKIFRSRCADEMPEFTDDTTCIILDDLCRGGFTFELAAQELRRNGCKHIALCVTHLEAVAFQPGKILREGSCVDKIYATNSCLPNYKELPIPEGGKLTLANRGTYPFID